MNDNERIRLVVRAVGAAIVLLSVLLTWLSISFIFTVELSLLRMVRLVLEAPQNGSQETLGPLAPVVVITLFTVILGGIVAFPHSIGGVVPLIGAGFFIYQIESMIGGTALFSYGIGLFAAIGGSILVMAATAIPKEKKR